MGVSVREKRAARARNTKLTRCEAQNAGEKSLFPFDNCIAYSPVSSGVVVNGNVLELLRGARAIVLRRADHIHETSTDGLAALGIGHQFIEDCVYGGLS